MGSEFDLSALQMYIVKEAGVPKIVRVETYNGKVVKVVFADGTFEKAVCSDNDAFDIDVGITICVLKKMLGRNGHKRYNDMIREAHRIMKCEEKIQSEQKRIRAERLRKATRVKEKAERRQAEARENIIELQVEAMRRFAEERARKEAE